MASIQPRGGKFQLRVKNKLLDSPYFYTFDTYEEAEAYGRQLEALLEKGVVPAHLLKKDSPKSSRLVDVIDRYLVTAPVAPSDFEVLAVVSKEVVGVGTEDLTYKWVQGWVRKLKLVQNLAPGTIRKRVESLARVMDWYLLETAHTKVGNPLRMLPRGYSTYSEYEQGILKEGQVAKTDVERNRRLLPGEYERIVDALRGVKREDRQRALGVDPHFQLMFVMVVETGMRLVEMVRLRWDQVDFDSKVVRVEGSKGHRGKAKPRVVPIKGSLLANLEHLRGTEGRVFPFWDGTKEDLRKASKRMTVRFGKLFEYAELKDITEHDLRHEAACRWFELRGDDGNWKFSDVEVCKIMGWSDYSMILRYASIRGEDLSKRL